MLVIIILSLGFMIHLWSFPYPFKNYKFDIFISFIQLAFSIPILIRMVPETIQLTGLSVITGFSVGFAFLIFHIIYNRGIRLKASDITLSFLLSQLIVFGIQIPAEEFLYRGIFFAITGSIWGTLTALTLSTSLSAMLYIARWRRPLYWFGAVLIGFFCNLAFYYTGSIWTAVIIHILNDFGYMVLNEKKNIFS